MKKVSSQRRRKRRLLLVGLTCVLAGVVLVAFSFLGSNNAVPPVDVLLNESKVAVSHGVYYDQIEVQNRAEENVTIIVAIKTPLDAAERTSNPVTICGHCRGTATIEEVQPQPDQNSDYYLTALENPVYVRAEYPPTLIEIFASFAEPIGLGVLTLGIVLLIYVHPNPG